MTSIIHDLRQSLRAWRRAPLFFAGAVLTLALGIGANAAVFSILQAVLLQPLPYQSPDRVVMVWLASKRPTNWRASTTSTTVVAWHDQSSDALESVASLKLWQGNLEAQFDLALPDHTERLRGGLVAPNFFQVLGVRPEQGRVFTSTDEAAGARDLVVLSYALWRRAFGGSLDVIGRAVSLTPGRGVARPFTVVGVLPAAFRFTYPLETEVWVLHPWSAVRAMRPDSIEFEGAVARLKPGVTLAHAQDLMATVGVPKLPAGWPETYRQSTKLEPVEAWVVGETRPSLLLLAAVAGLLLVITCATVASLLFVRVTERQRELAVRTALGADRSQIARLLLAEGAWLCFAGTAAGVLLALLIQPLLRAFVPPVVPRADQIGANVWTVVFAMVVALITVVLVAVLPAWRSGRFDVVSALKRASNTVSADASTTVWRRTLLAIQATVATALLVAAVLLLVSFWRLNRTPLGFDGDRVLTVEMRLQDRRFFKPEAIAAFQEAVTARVSAVPGILEVGLTSAVPFRGTDFSMAFDRPGVPNSRYYGNGRFVDTAFFSVMRIPLLAGRLFNRTDTATSPKVMIASEAFARSAFGSENPIGREIDASDPTTIVGVVGDLRYVSRDQAAAPAVYYPRIQRPSELICLVARTGPGAVDIGASIRRVIHQIDPGVPVMNLTTIDRIISESVANPQFLTVTTVAFSALALLLTLIGLAVLVARAVAERRREMAIRAALGAPAHTLVSLLLKQGLLPVAVGTIVGLASAFFGASLLGQFLFDIAPHQPVIYAGVAAFVAAVALPTCLVPARRVAAAVPATVLRAD